MSRNDRRRARQRDISPESREFQIRPDFAMDVKGGPTTVLMPGPVRAMPFLVDGKLQRFQEITLGGEPLPAGANEMAWAFASSMLFRHRDEPEIRSSVLFSILDLRKREAFYSNHDALRGALWMAKLPMFSDVPVSLEKLQPYVPTYNLINGLKHLRLRDCIDLLLQAASHSDLRIALRG